MICLALCLSTLPAPILQEPATQDLTAVLAAIRSEYDLPGLAGAVLKGGELVALDAVGVRERGSNVAVTPKDRFHLGSCTKAMTATLAATLVEEERLAWDSTLAEVFPELRAGMRPAWREVTLRQLLSHRSGAPAGIRVSGAPAEFDRLGRDGPFVEARLQTVRFVTAADPIHPPGTKYAYSNLGYIMAGAMIERVAGGPWEELLRKRVFEPLAMDSAGFGPPGSGRVLDQPRGHWPDGRSSGVHDNPPFIGPAGTVHASLSDWSKFVAVHLAGAQGRGGILESETFAALHEPYPAPGERYGCGWMSLERPWGKGDVLFHNGSNGAWYCVMWLAPKRDFAVLLATNDGSNTARKALDRGASALIEAYLEDAG